MDLFSSGTGLKCPCKGCQKRVLRCHSTCDDYKEYQSQVALRKAKEEEETAKYSIYSDRYTRIKFRNQKKGF